VVATNAQPGSTRYLERYISVPQAAELAGLSPQTFHKLLDDGLIPFIRPSVHRRVKRGDVLAYLGRQSGHEPAVVAKAPVDLLAD
jgi:excisionase family DNA binding protein